MTRTHNVPPPLLNKGFVIEVMEANYFLVNTLLSEYLISSPRYVASFRTAVDSKNWKDIAKCAHELRNTIIYFGAHHLETLLFEVECAALKLSMARGRAPLREDISILPDLLSNASKVFSLIDTLSIEAKQWLKLIREMDKRFSHECI